MNEPAAVFGPHPVLESVHRISGLLTEVDQAGLWALSDTEIAELVGEVHALTARLQALSLRLVHQADTRDLARTQGAPSTVAWLRGSHRLAPGDASRAVRLGRRRAGEFSATADALAAGTISVEQARAVVVSVSALPAKVPAPTRRAAEHTLLGLCADFDPVEVRRLGRHILAVVDPDLADELLAKKLAREEAEARDELRIMPDGAGGARLGGTLSAEGHAMLKAALDPLAAPRAGADGPDTRTPAQRLGDALVEVCRRALDQADLPTIGGDKPTVVVTVDFDDLRHRLRPALLDTGDVISPEAARRLACDADIIPAVLGSASCPLDLGRSSRLFTGPLRRALILRDGGCAFPGCDRPPQWCTGHHIKHWADGGPTALTNGVLICNHHHIVVHHHGWTIKIAADGHPDFIPPPWVDPTGRPRRNTRHRLKP